jgi:transcriptional regulator with XRE-family HTH domain
LASLESANVGKAVATRVGTNIRAVRTKLGQTQAQLAAPEFSISYISAIERGKIRPSLKALAILSRRLDVPLTFLLEGEPSGATEARAVGYSPQDSGPDMKVDATIAQAQALTHQGDPKAALTLLAPLKPERLEHTQVFRLHMARGKALLAQRTTQEAVVALRLAASQAEALNALHLVCVSCTTLGTAYYNLYNYTIALESHLRCIMHIESGEVKDVAMAQAAYMGAAAAYFKLGNVTEAQATYTKAVDCLKDQLKPRELAALYLQISQGAASAGNNPLSLDYANRSVAVYEMIEQQRAVAYVHLALGRTMMKQGDDQGAEREYNLSVTIAREVDDPATLAECMTRLSEFLMKVARLEEAERTVNEALDYAVEASRAGNEKSQALALVALAQIRNTQERYVEADEMFTNAVDMLERLDDHEQAATVLFLHSKFLEERQEIQYSLNTVKRAYAHQEATKVS